MEQGWGRDEARMEQGWGRDGAGGWGRDDGPWVVTAGEKRPGGGAVPSLPAHPVAHRGQSPFDCQSRDDKGFFPHAGLVGRCSGKGFLCLQRTA